MQLLKPIKDFFTRRRLSKEAEVIEEVEDPVEILLRAYHLLEEANLERWSIRDIVNRNIDTYSPDVEHLSRWLEWAWVTMTSNDYVPDKWKKLQHTLSNKSLDDWMSAEGHDVHPAIFFRRSGQHIRVISNILLSEPNNETEKNKLRYYRRQYSTLIQDCTTVMRTIFEVVK